LDEKKGGCAEYEDFFADIVNSARARETPKRYDGRILERHTDHRCRRRLA
jgi:hypothetical protein